MIVRYYNKEAPAVAGVINEIIPKNPENTQGISKEKIAAEIKPVQTLREQIESAKSVRDVQKIIELIDPKDPKTFVNRERAFKKFDELKKIEVAKIADAKLGVHEAIERHGQDTQAPGVVEIPVDQGRLADTALQQMRETVAADVNTERQMNEYGFVIPKDFLGSIGDAAHRYGELVKSAELLGARGGDDAKDLEYAAKIDIGAATESWTPFVQLIADIQRKKTSEGVMTVKRELDAMVPNDSEYYNSLTPPAGFEVFRRLPTSVFAVFENKLKTVRIREEGIVKRNRENDQNENERLFGTVHESVPEVQQKKIRPGLYAKLTATVGGLFSRMWGARL